MAERLFSREQIYAFIDRAGKATYAGGGAESEQPERSGFKELEYAEGEWSYIDSLQAITDLEVWNCEI